MPELIGSFFGLKVIALLCLRRDAWRGVELLQIRRNSKPLSKTLFTLHQKGINICS